MNDQQNGPGAALDELDVRILQVLQSDARITNRDLAAAVHVSPTTALDRTRSLRRRGVITGATLTLDFAALGRGVQALIAVRIRPPSREIIEAFRDWVAGLDESACSSPPARRTSSSTSPSATTRTSTPSSSTS
ncbi:MULTISPECIES: Lrp/AsnC family transcriptional regulator [unclassified Rathayibacter]|nr:MULTISPECIES: Lrp/AsnC family transcriptional regulator [unclassified Rathayibacter]